MAKDASRLVAGAAVGFFGAMYILRFVNFLAFGVEAQTEEEAVAKGGVSPGVIDTAGVSEQARLNALKHEANIAAMKGDIEEAKRLRDEMLEVQKGVWELQEMVQPTTTFDPTQLTDEDLARSQALADVSRPAYGQYGPAAEARRATALKYRAGRVDVTAQRRAEIAAMSEADRARDLAERTASLEWTGRPKGLRPR